EGRAFHVYVGAAVVDGCFEVSCGFQQKPPQFLADRIGKGNMANDAASKKCVLKRLFGAVQELVWQDNMARLVFRLQRADGADADDPSHSELLHRPNISAMIQFRGENAMSASMPGQKRHVPACELAGEQIV